jgi:hypothetical protein
MPGKERGGRTADKLDHLMAEDIILGVVLLAIPVGLWLTRNAKGPGGPPGSAAKNALLDQYQRRLARGQASDDQTPKDQ